MKRPIIFSVDDDPQVLRAVVRDLKSKYNKEHRILSTTNPQEALDSLTTLKKKNEVVALFLVDQRMPEMLGVEFLAEALKIYPEAKRVLLTAYSDTDAAIRAINEVQLDYYLTKPWNPPEEKLYPLIDDLLDAWYINYKPDFEGLKVLGYQYSPFTHEIKDFLASNLFPFQWIDVESNPKAEEVLSTHEIESKNLPAVVLEGGEKMENPSIQDLAVKLGFSNKACEELYDVVIVGAGPSGLAAAVYGGSEGLKTLLIEKRAPGGQAGSSSRIENYLGFPNGLSGQELTHRAITQARRFGIEFLSPKTVTSIRLQDKYKVLTLDDGNEVITKALILSTGVDYRKLEAAGISEFTGAGIYYGSSMTEAQACLDKEVFIVGGGNSAGQSAVYLSKFAKNVYILIRKPDLSSSMSQYLIDQIDAIDNIAVLGNTEIEKVTGSEGRLSGLITKSNIDGSISENKADALFIFIGSKPYTEWIDVEILKNSRGFIETGKDLSKYDKFAKVWKLNREPFMLETCVPGILASGDVRAGAMNRVASAVGEGSMAIKFVHEYLAEN